MTPEQQEFYDKELTIIKRGGNCKHDAFVVDCVWGMGSHNLGPVEPAVVGFCNDGDPFYVEYFNNWEEINAFIDQIRKIAVEAWGEENPAPYMTYPLSGIDVDPITGDLCLVKREE